MEIAPKEPARWALLIGINRYPNLGSEWQLEGCINDILIMQDTLLRRFGFAKDQITVLVDEQATRVGILAAMEELVSRVGQDDVVLFHYSGHGSQQTDEPDGDEPDHMDETLVPFDSGRPPRKNRDISDDEIHTWLCRLTDRTPYVTLIFDCCHSGTIARDSFAGKARFAPPDYRPFRELAVAAVAPESIASPDRSQVGPSGWLPLSEKYTLLAACSNAESANEFIVGEPRRVAHGALTYHLIQALVDPDLRRATWMEIFERIAPRLTAQFRSQHPQLEGARHREVCGVQTIQPMPYILVLESQEESLILEAGAACGMTVGSRWVVYPQATRNVHADMHPLGTVEIVAVDATTSVAKVVEATDVPGTWEGCRVVESCHCLKEVRIAVEVATPPGHSPTELLERISVSRFVQAVRSGNRADARIYLVPPRSRVRETDPMPKLGELAEESWVVVGEDGELLAPPLPTRHPQALELLVANLESVARLRRVLALRNPDNALEGKVEIRLHRLAGDSCVTPTLNDYQELVFEVGDFIVAEIYNGATRPLFFYLLDIGLTGRINLIYPVQGAREPQEPGSRSWVGRRQGERLRLTMPPDFALLSGCGHCPALEGRETFKLFATTAPASFDVLFQPGFQFRAGTAAQSLEEALSAIFCGERYGIFRSSKEDWMTLERTFRLRSRKAST